MAKAGITTQSDITITAREVDFVTRFGANWDALREILGIMRPIRKAPGTKLVSSVVSMKGNLKGGALVGEGEEIPYTEFQVEPVAYGDITLEKYAKAVSIEAVAKWGAKVAVQKTDEAFLNELQGNVMGRFYDFLQTGTLTDTESDFQMAVAMSIGLVVDKFKKMHKDVTSIVTFVNTLDAYRYLGAANLTVQTAFGIQYVKNFLGAETMVLSSEIPAGTVISIPSENIDLYYIDPGDGEFEELGLSYTVQGETNLIGFHANGNYSTAVGESFALMGMTLWAEYLDGIAVVTVSSSNPLTGLSVKSETDEATFPWTDKTPGDFQEGITVTGSTITGTLKFIEGGLAQSGPLAGDGYFLALTLADNTYTGLTSVKVGLQPSAGTGLVELINDPDKNGVFKVTNKDVQKFKVVQTASDGRTKTQTFDLSGLELEDAEGA